MDWYNELQQNIEDDNLSENEILRANKLMDELVMMLSKSQKDDRINLYEYLPTIGYDVDGVLKVVAEMNLSICTQKELNNYLNNK